MVSSTVIRGGGLLLLVITFVTLERVYNINVIEKASTLNNELIGAGRGSQYNVSELKHSVSDNLFFLSPLTLSLSLLILTRRAWVIARH